jgi:hypothetical protein
LTTVKNAGPPIELIKSEALVNSFDAVFDNNEPDLIFELIPQNAVRHFRFGLLLNPFD